jgi:hypothetical protein
MHVGRVLCDVCSRVVSDQSPQGKSEIPYFNLILVPHLGESEEDFSLDLCDVCVLDIRAGVEVLIETYRKK